MNYNGRIGIVVTLPSARLPQHLYVFVGARGQRESWKATEVEVLGDVRPAMLPFRFSGQTMFVYIK